jgi:hypothetical protein
MPSAKALAAMLWMALAACAEQRLPDALVDVWRTRAPGYEDRFLEVRADSVRFGTGQHATTAHALAGVEVETEPGGRVRGVLNYALHDGATAELRLILEPGPPATLRFENREELWHRERDASWLATREAR